MNSTGLIDTWRNEVVDTVQPYLWSDDEALLYAAEAQRTFCRLTGGVSDVSSEAAQVQITAGEPFSETHSSILRIMSAQRQSDEKDIRILNSTDLANAMADDYGQRRPLRLTSKTGSVEAGVIGLERGKIRWISVPEVDDIALLHIYRTPLTLISGFDQEIVDVAEDHHYALVEWMKHLCYKKKDVETFDQKESDEAEGRFRAYCKQAKAEWERQMYKVRSTSYGGL